jgi:hypothetical protein
MKLRLKGCRFDTIEEIQAESQEVLNTHLRTSRDAWNHGKKRWDRCIHAQGDYFEGDGGI